MASVSASSKSFWNCVWCEPIMMWDSVVQHFNSHLFRQHVIARQQIAFISTAQRDSNVGVLFANDTRGCFPNRRSGTFKLVFNHEICTKAGLLLKHCKLTRKSLQSCHVTSPDILNALFLRHHNTIAHFECINNASGMLVDAEFGNLESLTLQGSSFSHQKVVALSKSNNKNKNHAIRELDLGGSRFENTHISSVLLKFDSLDSILVKGKKNQIPIYSQRTGSI